MIKECVSFALCCVLLITANFTFISAQTSNTNNEDSSIAKIKANIAKRGTGEKKRVKVKKLDGTKLKGYISQLSEDSFTLTDSKTKQSTAIAYRDVAEVKGSGLSKGDKIALGIIVGAAAVTTIVLGSFILARCRNEGGC